MVEDWEPASEIGIPCNLILIVSVYFTSSFCHFFGDPNYTAKKSSLQFNRII